MNEKHGSFYLQSKIYRAKEALETDYRSRGLPVEEPPAEQPQAAPGSASQEQAAGSPSQETPSQQGGGQK